ncbi:MAG: hypothetical protein EAS52_19095 [Parapedobacter sp.]|nr:MAG: hypothetical protein EAS52_19095 [Parapedobacter sp.]
MNHNSENELIKELKTNQIKFVYFILGINLACIGFIANLSMDITVISCFLFTLLLSITSFLVSTLLGILYLESFNDSLIWEIYKKRTKSVKDEKNFLQASQNFEKSSEATSQYWKWMIRALYMGIVFFVLWRVLEILFK